MSIQLEILPQNYQGFVTDFTPPPLELITNGQVFGANLPPAQDPILGTRLITDYATSGAPTIPFGFWNSVSLLNNMSQDMLENFIVWNPGTFVSFRMDRNGTTGLGPQRDPVNDTNLAMDAQSSSPLLPFSIPTRFGLGYKFGYSLTAGQSYTLKIKIAEVTSATDPAGSLNVMHVPYNPNTQVVNSSIGSLSYPQSYPTLDSTTSFVLSNDLSQVSNGDVLEGTFTAVGNADCIWIQVDQYYQKYLEIESISCIKSGTEVAEFLVGNGSVIADLYEEENIPLTLSVDEFKNVAEKVQSYSKAFKLPSTKRNSQIFDNIFEITRTANGTNSFNPYIKTQCRLKEDGFVLFEGYLRMIDIIDKDGEISYNVNLYSEAVALADVLAEKTFNDLDFSELEHSYNFTQIKKTFDDSVGVDYINSAATTFRSATTIKYPFCDWTHQFTPYIDTAGTHPNNITFPVLENLQTAFRPFINVKYLVNKIFDSSPFEYTSNFFNEPDFENLYMDFNWGNGDAPLTASDTGTASYKSSSTSNYKFPNNFGTFDIDAGDTVNYATTSYTNVKFPNNNFGPAFGWNSVTNQFEIPSGLVNVLLECIPAVHYTAKKDCNVSFRWIKNEGQTTEAVYNEFTYSVSGSAIAFPILQGFQISVQHPITGIYLHEGGFYASAPTVETVPSGTPSPLTTDITATLTGTAVSAMSINTSAIYYSWSQPKLEFNEVSPHGVYSHGSPSTVPLSAGDTLALQWKSDVSTAVRQRDFGTQSLTLRKINSVNSTLQCSISYTGTVDDAKLKVLRGETEQWSFLKGLINMFNLITVPNKENPNNITIEPYNDIFIDNEDIVEHDWTDRVDVSEIKLTPLTDLNQKTLFKFVEDEDDYAFMNYKRQLSGFLYGSRLFDASGFTILGGETEEIEADPFAATVCKPMMSQFPELIVPAIYALNEEGTSEGFENAPRIMFNNGEKTLSQTQYLVLPQNGVATQEWMSTFLQFSHLSDIQTVNETRDFHFGPCDLIGLGNSPVDTLFSNYWQPYFGELYNADTRSMSVKVNLSAADINTFNLFDKVFIKNRTFRVNKIDYKPNDLSTVEFILIP